MSVLIFANDHRQNVSWDLPYIRFGGEESDAAIRCKNEILGKQVNRDEVPKIFWLWQNIDSFGCDIIGYCQYRRFFTGCQCQLPVINLHADAFKSGYALKPEHQESIIQNGMFDGILHPAFNVVNKNVTPFTFIWEQIAILEGSNHFPVDRQKNVFDIFLDHTPNELKSAVEKSFSVSENYLCNIFTAKKDVFKLFGSIAFPTVIDLLNLVTDEEKQNLHPYFLAYLFERLTSCFYHSLEISGKCKFAKLPLMTIDADKHIEWRQKESN